MKMKFRMKVEQLFKVGDKTIFAGLLDAEPGIIKDAVCSIEVDGQVAERIKIGGEVSGTRHRDLWTNSSVELSAGALASHEVWLIEV